MRFLGYIICPSKFFRYLNFWFGQGVLCPYPLVFYTLSNRETMKVISILTLIEGFNLLHGDRLTRVWSPNPYRTWFTEYFPEPKSDPYRTSRYPSA